MGREWYWVGGKSSKRAGSPVDKETASTTPGCMCSVLQLFEFHQFQIPSHHQQQQQRQPSSNLETLLSEEPPVPKGAKAPRNSLELDEPPPPNTVQEERESLNIPMGIQIKTNGVASNSKETGVPNDSSSSDISSSPSTKTPTLVARLMGLELLPDQSYYPISYSSTLETPTTLGKSHFRCRSKTGSNEFSGTRSLPETPRISSARRSDVEHRLSLQINKENMSPNQELVLSRISSSKRQELKTEEEINRSPGRYARQIVKQVKEKVSRKVGLDITNTVRSRDHELVNQLKTKKIMSKVLTRVAHDDTSSSCKNSSAASASCSPRLKFLGPRNNKPISTTTVTLIKDHNIISQSAKPSSSATSLQVNVVPQKTKSQQDQQRPVKKCKNVGEERFAPSPRQKKPPHTSDIIRNKQEEPFVRQATLTRANIADKKCKKTPLSNDLLNNPVPTLLPLKKDPPPRATKIPQKQAPNSAQESKRSSQLSSCSSQQSYKEQEVKHMNTTSLDDRGISSSSNEDRPNGAVSATTTISTCTGDKAAAKEEYEYISRILKRTGIDKDTPVSFTRWFSPSHPLDPSIYYHLEYFTTIPIPSFANSNDNSQLSHRCNRKLLFHLVDEILVDILKPYLNIKPWAEKFYCSSASSIIKCNNFRGSDLVDMLCSKIRSFPRADCRVLEDIDALIDKDMPQSNVQNKVSFCEAGEGIVAELEKNLLDDLIHDTTVVIHGGV